MAVLNPGKHLSGIIIFERKKSFALETVKDFKLRAMVEAPKCQA
jgi:hypothetical protein